MPALADDAVTPAFKFGHCAFHDDKERAVVFPRTLAHELNGGRTLVGHDCGMKIQTDDFKQHLGNGRMHTVEDGHGTPRASLPLQPEYGRQLPRECARQGLAHGRMEHAGNPVARNRTGAEFDEVAS